MTTPEQQARQMLGRMKVEHADYYSAGDLVELANLIAENAALKAELAAINGAGEPVACLIRHRHARARAHAAIDGRNHYSDWSSWEPARLSYGLAVTRPSRVYPDSEPIFEIKPLYTRPAVPLTDEQIDALWRAPMSADWEHREFARAIEAAHGIKGA